MQKIIKKVLLWCMALLLISTMHPISASAATKKVDLKTPVIYNLKCYTNVVTVVANKI